MYTVRHVVRVPNKPATPHRTIRIPNELWDAVKRKAADEEVTVSEVVIQLLTKWVNEYSDPDE